MQGKSLEAVREHLEKRWDNEPILPVYNVASFDTGHTLEERVANYKKLRELTLSIVGRHGSNVHYKKSQFFSRRPTLEEIRRCWAICSFKGEVEKAIVAHPEWGYQVTDGQVYQVAVGYGLGLPPLRKVTDRARLSRNTWKEVLECGHKHQGTHLAKVAHKRRCHDCLNHLMTQPQPEHHSSR